MKHRKTIVSGIAAALALSLTSVAAADSSTVVVTPDDQQGWEEENIRGDGVSAITSQVGDQAGGDGSLEQSFSDGSGKTDFRLLDDFGSVEDLVALGFDWYRDGSSTAPAHLTPAVGVFVADDAGNSWLLKWEGVYNGYPSDGAGAPTDEWVTENLISANFWRIPQFVDGDFVGFNDGCNAAGDPFGCFQFDRSLDDAWLEGFNVVGIEIGVGSGWNGTWLSYADLVTINDTTFDFEVAVEDELTSKDDCKDGGWESSGQFNNQGQCVASFQANERAGR